MEDMLNATEFQHKMVRHVDAINRLLVDIYAADPLEAKTVAREYANYAAHLLPYIDDTARIFIKRWKRLAGIGGRCAGNPARPGSRHLPIRDQFSNHCRGCFNGLGIGIHPVERVIGVTKAFQTRVGAGPFPTEVLGRTAERLRGTGKNPWDEYGTTTGRPRRVGWLDGVLLRYALRVNGVTELMVTKMDILSGLSNLRLCVAYNYAGRTIQNLPMGPANLIPFKPVYDELAGWEQDISSVRRWQDLPEEARGYIRRIEDFCGVPVRRVSVGPERSQVVEVST